MGLLGRFDSMLHGRGRWGRAAFKGNKMMVAAICCDVCPIDVERELYDFFMTFSGVHAEP
jgi:hypothetical protein